MKLKHYTILFLMMTGVAAVVASCIEPYATPESSKAIDILVVDGFLDVAGSVNVKLSKAVNISDENGPQPVSNATVQLEDSDAIVALLNINFNGEYAADGLTIDNTKQYRIRIKTGGKEFLSDFITPKTSPPIDSVSWTASSDGITINVNTHDNSGLSRYYLWTFEETYEYRAPIYSPFILVNDTLVIPRSAEENIFTCWRTLTSQNIHIGTSYRLEQDIIQNKALTFIPKGDIKTSVKYSILVRQAVLSREAYDFWDNLSRTTEQLGTLFDPQPGKVVGNIHNVENNKEPVLGYFDGGHVVEKRIFIRNGDLPKELRVPMVYDCRQDSILLEDFAEFDKSQLITGAITEGIEVIGYLHTSRSCADCRLQKGVVTKPSFWQ